MARRLQTVPVPGPSGRSRGGLTTRAVAVVDALGYLVRLTVLPGQAHGLQGVPGLPGGLPFGAFVGDRASGADWLLEDLDARGAEPVIPARRNWTAPRRVTGRCTGGGTWWTVSLRRPGSSGRSRRAVTGPPRASRPGFTPSPEWWPRHECQQALGLGGARREVRRQPRRQRPELRRERFQQRIRRVVPRDVAATHLAVLDPVPGEPIRVPADQRRMRRRRV